MTENQIIEYFDHEADDFIAVLDKVSVDPEKWTTIYRDPKTGLLWLKDSPQGNLHGGGPRRIRLITDDLQKMLNLNLETD
jgi:Immunity protein 27